MRSSIERLPREVRDGFAALAAAATGTAAGILVDSKYGIRRALIDPVLEALGPVFDAFSAFPNGQILLAATVQRVPVIVMTAFAVALVLRYIRYRRLLFGCVLVWPALLLVRWLVSWTAMLQSGGQVALSYLWLVLLPEVLAYSAQYLLLFLVIRATSRMLARTAVDGSAPVTPG